MSACASLAASLVAVDRVEITVLVDNVTDSLSCVPDNVTKEWDVLRLMGMKTLAGSCQCCANHSLSLLIKTWSQRRSHALLFDAGPAEETLAYNVERLGNQKVVPTAVGQRYGLQAAWAGGHGGSIR